MRRPDRWEGLLPIDKPTGPSSHDMVALTRSRLGIRRVGHTGTLDPFASGLLLLCLGRTTRLAEYLTPLDKEYLACARLGITTATDDPEGEVTAVSEEWRGLETSQIEDALGAFSGVVEQRPPDFSAKKIQGRAAYALARRGERVSLRSVPVTIHEIELQSVHLPEIRFRVRCSAGTYIRGIARDLGERLGVGAHLTELRRIAIGPFHVRDALSPDALKEPDRVARSLISPIEAVAHLPRLEVSREEASRIESGQSLYLDSDASPAPDGEHAVIFGARLLAVAVRDGRRVRPRKVFTLD